MLIRRSKGKYSQYHMQSSIPSAAATSFDLFLESPLLSREPA